MQTTWDWVMGLINKPGWTLVNVVGAIWGVASATISAVKSVVSDPLNALKIVGQFIMDTVLGIIIDLIVQILIGFIKAFVISVGSVFSEIQYSLNSNGVVINGEELKIERNGLNIELQLFNLKITIENVLINPSAEFETLSVVPNEILAIQALKMVNFGLFTSLPSSAGDKIIAATALSAVSGFILNFILVAGKIKNNQDTVLYEQVEKFHNAAWIGLLIPFAIALGQDAINAKFINGRPNAKMNRANLDSLLNYGLAGLAFLTGEIADVFSDPSLITLIGLLYAPIEFLVSENLFKGVKKSLYARLGSIYLLLHFLFWALIRIFEP